MKTNLSIDISNELKRKSFHMIGIIYAVGIACLPRPVFIGSVAGLLLVVFVVESLRLRVLPVNDWFFLHFGGLFRKKEQNRFSGVVWMLAGILFSAVALRPVPLVIAVILYLVIGDTLASVAGKSLGGPKLWCRKDKSISGSLSCFVSCLGVGWFVLTPEYGALVVIWGALAATLGEIGLPSVDDNFALPVFTSVAFLLFINSF